MRPDLVAWIDSHGTSGLHWLVPSSGFMYGVLFIVAGIMMWRRGAELRLPAREGLDAWIAGAIGTALGARLYFLLIHGMINAAALRLWIGHAGTGSWGGFAGAALAIGTFARVRGLPRWRWVDVAASVAPLAEVVGRWACWLAGDDFGRVSNVAWAITFPRYSLAWRAQVVRGDLVITATRSLAVHPQQFYLMLNAAVLALVVPWLWRRLRDRPSATFAAYLVLYGATRFWWEFFRDPAAGGATPGVLAGLSSSQWMCLLYAAAGTTLMIILRRKRAGDTASA